MRDVSFFLVRGYCFSCQLIRLVELTLRLARLTFLDRPGSTHAQAKESKIYITPTRSSVIGHDAIIKENNRPAARASTFCIDR